MIIKGGRYEPDGEGDSDSEATTHDAAGRLALTAERSGPWPRV